ncbi:MAG: cupin domain-containing protein [Acidimicrobiales bacterium]
MVQWGDHTVVFEKMPGGTDPSDSYKGLPDDRCQCRHFGVLQKGKMIIRYGDSEEMVTAGQAYYIEPGHLPYIVEDAEVIEFTLTEELKRTIEAAARNAAQSGTSGEGSGAGG